MIGINDVLPQELIYLSGFIGALLLILYIPYYLYTAYIYYRMGKKADVPKAWIAFIPTGTYYIKLKISKLPLLLIFLPIFTFFIILILANLQMPKMLLLICLIMFLVVIITNMVISIVMDWKVLEYFGRSGVLSLSVLLGIGQVVMLVVYSIVAFESGKHYNERNQFYS